MNDKIKLHLACTFLPYFLNRSILSVSCVLFQIISNNSDIFDLGAAKLSLAHSLKEHMLCASGICSPRKISGTQQTGETLSGGDDGRRSPGRQDFVEWYKEGQRRILRLALEEVTSLMPCAE